MDVGRRGQEGQEILDAYNFRKSLFNFIRCDNGYWVGLNKKETLSFGDIC